MIVIALRTQKNDPVSLSSELVAAREQYTATKNSVLDRAQSRHAVVGDTISDLRSEQAALENVIASAR